MTIIIVSCIVGGVILIILILSIVVLAIMKKHGKNQQNINIPLILQSNSEEVQNYIHLYN